MAPITKIGTKIASGSTTKSTKIPSENITTLPDSSMTFRQKGTIAVCVFLMLFTVVIGILMIRYFRKRRGPMWGDEHLPFSDGRGFADEEEENFDITMNMTQTMNQEIDLDKTPSAVDDKTDLKTAASTTGSTALGSKHLTKGSGSTLVPKKGSVALKGIGGAKLAGAKGASKKSDKLGKPADLQKKKHGYLKKK